MNDDDFDTLASQYLIMFPVGRMKLSEVYEENTKQ